MFVDKMPLLEAMKQSVATHTCIAEMIKENTDNKQFLDALHVEQEFLNYQNTDRAHDYVEEAALWEVPLPKLLRVACLQSVVNSGLKPKVLNAYRKDILHAYGHKHMIPYSIWSRWDCWPPKPVHGITLSSGSAST